MKHKAACWGFLVGITIGCQQGSPTSPPASSKKSDVPIDAPGVKVDVKGQKKEP